MSTIRSHVRIGMAAIPDQAWAATQGESSPAGLPVTRVAAALSGRVVGDDGEEPIEAGRGQGPSDDGGRVEYGAPASGAGYPQM